MVTISSANPQVIFLVTCPECKGKTGQEIPYSGIGDSPTEYITCEYCDNDASASPTRMQWYARRAQVRFITQLALCGGLGSIGFFLMMYWSWDDWGIVPIPGILGAFFLGGIGYAIATWSALVWAAIVSKPA